MMESAMSLLSRVLCLSLAFAAPAGAAPAQSASAADAPTWLPRAPQTVLHVLTWNVERAFLQRNADFQRVLRAIDADVLVLDEMAADLSATRIAAAMPPQHAP